MFLDRLSSCPTTMKLLFMVQVLLYFLLAAKASTEVRVISKQKSVIVGRAMAFNVPLDSYVIIEPEGYEHTAHVPEDCPTTPGKVISWKNKYGIAYVDTFSLGVASDGLNDEGLSVAILLLPGYSKFQKVPRKKCGSTVSDLEFTLWILGNFPTVKALRKALESPSFPLVWERSFYDLPTELHYSITDKSGEGIVIEYTKEGRRVFDNTVGVVTNSPPYDFHMRNLGNYVGLSKMALGPLVLGKNKFAPIGQGSGLLGVPGDFTPPSRFIRTAAIAHFANKVETSEEAVNLAFHILHTADIPIGVASSFNEYDNLPDFTQWVVVKDLTNKVLYFRSYNDLTVRKISISDALRELSPPQRREISVEGPVGGFVDITNRLTLVEDE